MSIQFGEFARDCKRYLLVEDKFTLKCTTRMVYVFLVASRVLNRKCSCLYIYVGMLFSFALIIFWCAQ